MSLSTCKVCARSYRTGRIAFIMGEHGKLSGARVCQDCASDGVLVVAARAAARCRCGKAATKCGTCASDSEQKDRADVVRDAVKRLRALLKANEAGRVPGLPDWTSSGLESAIELLDSGRF